MHHSTVMIVTTLFRSPRAPLNLTPRWSLSAGFALTQTHTNTSTMSRMNGGNASRGYSLCCGASGGSRVELSAQGREYLLGVHTRRSRSRTDWGSYLAIISSSWLHCRHIASHQLDGRKRNRNEKEWVWVGWDWIWDLEEDIFCWLNIRDRVRVE